VLVSLNQAGAGEGMPQDLLRVCLGRALRAVLGREGQRPGRMLDLVLEDGAQRRSDRNQICVPSLCGVALV
jgi:hypothetical protein